VTGLKKEDFKLSLNGVPRDIAFFSSEPQPIALGIVLDNSFSMSYDNKLDRAKEAAITLVHAVPDGSEYFYETFDDEVRLVHYTTPDRNAIDSAISETALGRGTSLFDAVIQGIDLSRRTMRYRQVLVVISDGADTHSKQKLTDLMKAARESEVQIYTIGYFNPEEDQLFRTNGAEIKMTARTVHNPRVVLTELSQQSGGRAFFPKTDAAMTTAVEAIVQDIRSQYSIEFYKQPTDNDTYQELRLVIPGHRGPIRTRLGFGGR
jgi:VWFA-related protein